MSAPDFETLYQFDENMQSSFAALLTAAGLTNASRGDNEDLATPFAAIEFVTGAARDHWKLMDDGSQRPDSFNAKLTIGIKTNRGVAAQDGKQAEWKAIIRKLFYDVKTNFTAVKFPLYYIARIMESGESPSLVTADDHEITGMEWDIIFGIRADAWPE